MESRAHHLATDTKENNLSSKESEHKRASEDNGLRLFILSCLKIGLISRWYLRQLLDQLPTPKSFDGFSNMLSSFKTKSVKEKTMKSSIIILAQISISKISVVEIFRLCIYDDIVFRSVNKTERKNVIRMNQMTRSISRLANCRPSSQKSNKQKKQRFQEETPDEGYIKNFLILVPADFPGQLCSIVFASVIWVNILSRQQEHTKKATRSAVTVAALNRGARLFELVKW
ncbi:unnamed protein product [Rhizophagus irregularis]|nr:unnamed protein product [Rhizophagus irregularis]